MLHDLLLFLIIILITALSYRWYRIYHNPSASISLANNFNFKNYVGKWYVIAHLPNMLENNVENLTVSHELIKDNQIKITITGNKRHALKSQYRRVGKMWPRYNASRPSLNVEFVWPFSYICRVIYISGNYDIVIFTTYTKNRLWIMAKTPEISDKQYQQLLEICRKKTFDLSKLEKIHHKLL